MREYDDIAEWYARTRHPDVGIREVTSLAQALAPGARMLELGCGNGAPLTSFLIKQGFQLQAIDSSQAMVDRFRITCPDVPVRCARIQELTVEPGAFAAVLAWGVLFHLDPAEQMAALAMAAAALEPGGYVLFTAGERAGTVEGTMQDVIFRYYSLNEDDYRSLLQHAGCDLIDRHSDAWDNVVYLGRRRACV